MKHEHGFTLIELLVVISIIGILTIVGITRYMSFNDREKFRQDVQNVRTAMREAQRRAQALEMSSSSCAGRTLDGWYFQFSGNTYSIYGKCESIKFSEKSFPSLKIGTFDGQPAFIKYKPNVCPSSSTPCPNLTNAGSVTLNGPVNSQGTQRMTEIVSVP